MKGIKELNKKVLIILPVLLAILIIAGVGVRIHVSNNQPDLPNSEQTNEDTQPVEDVQPTENTTEDDVFTVTLPTEFKPFECSKNDTPLYICATAYKDISLFGVDVFSDELYYLNGDEKEIFKFPETLDPNAYIGNALFLTGSDALYRIEIDENGYYDLDSLSLVTDFRARPAFVDENKLLLFAGSLLYPNFILLDTFTGEYEETDDCDKILSEAPSGLISAKKAEEIALKEIQKSEYQDRISGFTFSIATDRETNSNLTELYYRPDLSTTLGGWYQYESIPEYCWFVHAIADNDIFDYPQITVCVNAQTGSVAHVRILLPD